MKFPDNDAGSDAYVHRMFGAILRYLNASVAVVDYLLMHTLHLVTEYDSGVLSGIEDGESVDVIEHCGTLTLLDGIYKKLFLVEIIKGFKCCREVFPCHAVLASECRLVNLGVWRCGGDAA